MRTLFGNYAPSKNGQYLPQGLFGKIDSNISTTRLYITYSKANN